MKNLEIEKIEVAFVDYVLSVEEMICVKGGEGDPILVPTPPSPRV